MLDFVFKKPSRNLFRFFNRYRTDEDGLSFFVTLDYGVDDSLDFPLFRGVNNVGHIDSLHGFVCGDFENVKSVNSSEFFLFRFRRTRHTRKFVIQTEIVLERYRRVSFVFVSDRDVFFRFDSLVQAFGISSAYHQTTGKFVDDYDFAVRNEVVRISFENEMRLQRLLNVVVEIAVFDIGKIFDTEEPLGFSRALLGYLNRFIFNVNNVIFVRLERFDETVTFNVKVGRFFASAGNDKGRSRFVDKNGIHFVDDGEVEFSLNHVRESHFEVISQIVETELVVCTVSNVAVISGAFLVVRHIVNVHADGQPQKSVNLTHPFRVTFCKIIVDRNDMHSLFAERVEVSGKRCHKGFTFACFQLRNSALMHAYTAH